MQFLAILAGHTPRETGWAMNNVPAQGCPTTSRGYSGGGGGPCVLSAPMPCPTWAGQDGAAHKGTRAGWGGGGVDLRDVQMQRVHRVCFRAVGHGPGVKVAIGMKLLVA